MDERDSTPEQPRVTTVADAVWKAKIEPYAEHAPMLDIPTGVIACQFCGYTRFRRSRVRFTDMLEILLLRLPLRCLRCNQRQYGSGLTASLAAGTRDHGTRLAKGNDTWKAWTEQDLSGTMHRPMSTAVGTKATKLQPRLREQGAQTPPRTPRKAGWRDEDRQIW